MNKEICPNCETVATKTVFIDKETEQRHCSKCYNLTSKDESLLWNFEQYHQA